MSSKKAILNFMRYISSSFVILIGFITMVASCGGGGGRGNGTANENPRVSFTATQSTDFGSLTVYFDASGSSDPDGNITNYVWDFGDGQTSTGSESFVSHEYQKPAILPVKLTVTDNEGNQAILTQTVTVSQSDTWIGYYKYGLTGKESIALYVKMIQSGTSLSGSFKDQDGREGTVSGTIAGDNVTIVFTQTTQECTGTFTGTGIIVDSTILRDAKTIFIDFTWNDCSGPHTDGTGILFMQKSEVLAWGENYPAGLVYSNGELFWSDTSFNPLKKLNLATGQITPLACLMNSISSLNLGGNKILWTDQFDNEHRVLMIANADGTDNHALASGDFYDMNILLLANVLSDGAYAYWVKKKVASESPFFIERIPLAGGDPELIKQSDYFRNMAIDDTYLYWSEGGVGVGLKIFRFPFNSNQPTPETIFDDDTVAPFSDIVLSGDKIVFVVMHPDPDPNRIYWGYEIVSIPKSGGAVTDIAYDRYQITQVLADDNTVFWLNEFDDFQSVSIEGGEISLFETSEFDSIRDIALSSTQVYLIGIKFNWETYNYYTGIYYFDKKGGTIKELSPRALYAKFVRIDDNDDVIYADGGQLDDPTGIYRVTTDGVLTNLIVGIDGSSVLAVDDQYIYATQGSALKRISREGGNATYMATMSTFGPSYQLESIAAEENYVYFHGSQGLERVPNNAPGSVEFIVDCSITVNDLKVQNGYIYWIDGFPDTKFYRAPVNGGDRQLIAEGVGYSNFVVDSQYIYFVEHNGTGQSTLSKIPVTGGDKIYLGSYTDFNPFWCAMAQDSEYIYLATPDGFFKSEKSGEVFFNYELPPVFTYYTPIGLAVDDNFLYWTDPITDSVQRAPK